MKCGPLSCNSFMGLRRLHHFSASVSPFPLSSHKFHLLPLKMCDLEEHCFEVGQVSVCHCHDWHNMEANFHSLACMFYIPKLEKGNFTCHSKKLYSSISISCSLLRFSFLFLLLYSCRLSYFTKSPDQE